LLGAVSELAEVVPKLGGRSVREAVEGFLQNVASVKRKNLAEAVEEFITAEEPKTKALDGQRPQLSPEYFYNRAIQLRRFANAFPGHAVCDIGKVHLDSFVGTLDNDKPLVPAVVAPTVIFTIPDNGRDKKAIDIGTGEPKQIEG
jgi:hypothetical protein